MAFESETSLVDEFGVHQDPRFVEGTKIGQLIRYSEWGEVALRIRDTTAGKDEARKPSRHGGYLCHDLWFLQNAPISCIHLVLTVLREVLTSTQPLSSDECPMHVAARIAGPKCAVVISDIYNLAPTSLLRGRNDGLLPIHIACCVGNETAIEMMLRLNRDTAKHCVNIYSYLPLHAACSKNVCVDSVLEAYPDGTKQLSSDRSFPIQKLMKADNINTQFFDTSLILTIKAFPEVLMLLEKNEYHPMYLAATLFTKFPRVIDTMLSYFPELAKTKFSENTPIHGMVEVLRSRTSAPNNKEMESLELLIQAYPESSEAIVDGLIPLARIDGRFSLNHPMLFSRIVEVDKGNALFFHRRDNIFYPSLVGDILIDIARSHTSENSTAVFDTIFNAFYLYMKPGVPVPVDRNFLDFVCTVSSCMPPMQFGLILKSVMTTESVFQGDGVHGSSSLHSLCNAHVFSNLDEKTKKHEVKDYGIKKKKYFQVSEMNAYAIENKSIDSHLIMFFARLQSALGIVDSIFPSDETREAMVKRQRREFGSRVDWTYEALLRVQNRKGQTPLHSVLLRQSETYKWAHTSFILSLDIGTATVMEPNERLYPFMLAAIGEDSCVTCIYELLHPYVAKHGFIFSS